MNKYQLNLNLGSEVLGSGKTITATEVVESASSKELDPEVTDLTLDNISALAQKAGGVRGRAKAEAEPALQDALEKMGISFALDEKVERAYIARKSEGSGSGSPDSGEGDDDNTEL